MENGENPGKDTEFRQPEKVGILFEPFHCTFH